jgi:hypothetical protein
MKQKKMQYSINGPKKQNKQYACAPIFSQGYMRDPVYIERIKKSRETNILKLIFIHMFILILSALIFVVLYSTIKSHKEKIYKRCSLVSCFKEYSSACNISGCMNNDHANMTLSIDGVLKTYNNESCIDGGHVTCCEIKTGYLWCADDHVSINSPVVNTMVSVIMVTYLLVAGCGYWFLLLLTPRIYWIWKNREECKYISDYYSTHDIEALNQSDSNRIQSNEFIGDRASKFAHENDFYPRCKNNGTTKDDNKIISYKEHNQKYCENLEETSENQEEIIDMVPDKKAKKNKKTNKKKTKKNKIKNL